MNDRRIYYWLACLVVCSFLGCRAKQEVSSPPTIAPDQKIEVQFEIRYDGRMEDRKFSLECGKEETVFQAMERAKQAGWLDFAHAGKGELVFIRSLDGTKNEGGNGNNWIFYVNQQLAEGGCGAVKLYEGDRVTWKFGKYEF